MTINSLEKYNPEKKKDLSVEENKILPVDENKDFPVATNNVNEQDSTNEDVEKENITEESTEKKEESEKIAGEVVLEKEEITILTEAEQSVSCEAKEGDQISKNEAQINFEELSAKLKESREALTKEKFDFYQDLLNQVKDLSNENKEELDNLVHEFCLFNEITDPDEIALLSDRDVLLKNIQFHYKPAYEQYKGENALGKDAQQKYQEIKFFLLDLESSGIDSFEKLSDGEKNDFLEKYEQLFSLLDQDNPIREEINDFLSQFLPLQAGESVGNYIFKELLINKQFQKWEHLNDLSAKKHFLESYINAVRQPKYFLVHQKVFKKIFPKNISTISNNEELIIETRKEIDNLDKENKSPIPESDSALDLYQKRFSELPQNLQDQYFFNFEELMTVRQVLEENYINSPLEEQNSIYTELISVDRQINDFFLMLENGDFPEMVTNEEQKLLDFQERFFSWSPEIQSQYQAEYKKLIEEYTSLCLFTGDKKGKKEIKEQSGLISVCEEKIENLFSSIEKRFQTTALDNKLLTIDFHQYFSNIEKLDEQALADLFELLVERDGIISQGEKKIIKNPDYYEGKMNEAEIFSHRLDKYLRVLYPDISINDKNRTELIDSLRNYLIEIDNFSKLCQQERDLSENRKKIDVEEYLSQSRELRENIDSYLAAFSQRSNGSISVFLGRKNILDTDLDLQMKVSDDSQKRVDHVFGRDQKKFVVNVGDYLTEFGEIKNKISSHEISFVDAKNVYSEVAHRLIADATKIGCRFDAGIGEHDKLYIAFNFLQKNTKNKYEKEKLKEIWKKVYVDFDLQEESSIEKDFKDLLNGIERARDNFSHDVLTMKGLDERLNFYANEIKTMAKNLNINIENQTISSLLNRLAEESGMSLMEINEIKKLYENFSTTEIKKETQELISKITAAEKKIDPNYKKLKLSQKILSVAQGPITKGLTGGAVGFSLFRWAFKFLDYSIFNNYVGNGLKSLFSADKK